jgi:3-methyladenine DNA glycosylase AlkD
MAARKAEEIQEKVAAALAALERAATAKDRANLARFGIDAPKAFGVSMANMQKLAKGLGRSHELAEALWRTGWYEARSMAAFVDEPARVTPEQMDRWCRDFDNWAVCDTLCFKLFDQTPHAWEKARAWAASPEEFVKRAAFALLASLAGHDREATDEQFLAFLPLIEEGAKDERNFVKKGVSWALRGIGRRTLPRTPAAMAAAERLARSPEPSCRWVGKDALRDFAKVGYRTAGTK